MIFGGWRSKPVSSVQPPVKMWCRCSGCHGGSSRRSGPHAALRRSSGTWLLCGAGGISQHRSAPAGGRAICGDGRLDLPTHLDRKQGPRPCVGPVRPVPGCVATDGLPEGAPFSVGVLDGSPQWRGRWRPQPHASHLRPAEIRSSRFSKSSWMQ